MLSKDVKDENLRRWFSHIAGEIEKLEPKRPVSTGRKIQQLVAALEEVEQFHQVDGSLQTKQYLLDTRLNLQKMVRTLHVTDQSLMSLAVISDTSWAWGAIQRHTPILHERIRKDPQSVLKLRCLFLKLKSVLELPLLRISQIGSPDVYSVGEFYSQELVQYVRSVVEVIPKSMFSILTRIIAVQTVGDECLALGGCCRGPRLPLRRSLTLSGIFPRATCCPAPPGPSDGAADAPREDVPQGVRPARRALPGAAPAGPAAQTTAPHGRQAIEQSPAG